MPLTNAQQHPTQFNTTQRLCFYNKETTCYIMYTNRNERHMHIHVHQMFVFTKCNKQMLYIRTSLLNLYSADRDSSPICKQLAFG